MSSLITINHFLVYAFTFASSVLVLGVPVVYVTADGDDSAIRGFVEPVGAVWVVLLILLTAVSLLVL